MEESTVSYSALASLRKAHYEACEREMEEAKYEAQEREMAWNPTSHHGYECTSTYQEELPYGNHFQEDQYGYGESYQSRDMAYNDEEYYDYEEAYNYEENYEYQEASPSLSYEDIKNMLKLLLEEQERNHKNHLAWMDAMDAKLERDSKDLNNQEKSMEESLLMDRHEVQSTITPPIPIIDEDPSSFTLPCAIEKKEYKHLSWEELEKIVKSWDEKSGKAQLKDLETSSNIIEDEETIRELVWHCGYTVVENCMIRYEDPCEDDVVVECMEDNDEKSIVKNELSTKKNMQVQHIVKQETKVEKAIEKQDNLIKISHKEDDGEESPKAKPFSKHHGIILTIKLGIDDRWKLPFFEEVRMNEFRGWFYDEYDPGDPSSCHTPFLKCKRSLLSGRVCGEDSTLRSHHRIRSGA